MEESEILELPQETASVRRSDFPIRVRASDGRVFIVLLEVQSRWEPQVPLRLLEYDVRHRLKTGLSVLPVVMLLTPSGNVVESFEDGGIRYRFRVISLAAMDAREVVDRGNPCLMPFVGLMRGGSEVFQMAEEAIYGSGLGRSDKADLLTGMALLTGLVSKDLPQLLLKRRKDIMIESAAYELIKKEGYLEGRQHGMVESARRLIVNALEARFDLVPSSAVRALQGIEDPETLELLHRTALRVESVEAFLEKIRAMRQASPAD